MGRPRKIKTYNPKLSAAQNAKKNGVSVETMKTYIRVNGIDKSLDRKNAIIEKCRKFYLKNPNCTWEEMHKNTGYSLATIRKYRFNILSGEKLKSENKNKVEKRLQNIEDTKKKQKETLSRIPAPVISEYIAEQRPSKRSSVDANRYELWSSVLKEIPHMLFLPLNDNYELLRAFHEFLVDVAPEKPMLIIGSGGTNRAFASLLYGLHSGIGKDITPMQFASISDKAVKSCKILLISKGGKNDDIVYAAKRAVNLNPKYTACLTFQDSPENRLLKIIRRSGAKEFVFDHPEIHDGFTSVRSKFYRYALLLRAFSNGGEYYDYSRFTNLSPKACFEYRLNKASGDPVGFENIEHFIVLYGGFGEPVAVDFESVMVEAGVASVQISDYRNYCHGRFIFASNHTENDKEPRLISNVAIVLLISPREVSIASQIMDKVIPSKTPIVTIFSDYDSPMTTIDMLVKSNVLIAEICEGCYGINPYSPQNYSSIDKRVPMHGISFIEELERRRGLSFRDPVDPSKRNAIKDYLTQEKQNTIRIEEQKSYLPRPTIFDLDKNERYDASKYLCWAFRGKEDLRKNTYLPLGNMNGGFPFEMQGITFKNLESAYICGLFSKDDPDSIWIQEKLINEPSGFNAKKFIRSKYEAEHGREDWYSFNIDWMMYCMWHKVQGNAEFRELLKSVPEGATIVEDSTFHPKTEPNTASFWGCRNSSIESFHDEIKYYATHLYPNDKKTQDRIIRNAMNQFCNYGIFAGKNVMGKILMIIKDCLHNGIHPPIDYEVIDSANIHLLGKRIDEKANAIKYHHLPEDFYD